MVLGLRFPKCHEVPLPRASGLGSLTRYCPIIKLRVLLETDGSDAVLEKIDLASAIGLGRVTKEVIDNVQKHNPMLRVHIS